MIDSRRDYLVRGSLGNHAAVRKSNAKSAIEEVQSEISARAVRKKQIIRDAVKQPSRNRKRKTYGSVFYA